MAIDCTHSITAYSELFPLQGPCHVSCTCTYTSCPICPYWFPCTTHILQCWAVTTNLRVWPYL